MGTPSRRYRNLPIAKHAREGAGGEGAGRASALAVALSPITIVSHGAVEVLSAGGKRACERFRVAIVVV